jgi:DNA-binding transcriptional LysR family regulator
MTKDGQNSHLDTLEGRYWQLLEWRALARALGSSETERASAVRDALAFRSARRQVFPTAAGNEVLEEIREGLAHYTATVTTASSPQDAVSSAIRVLADYAQRESLVRDFAYASGTAYGVLLDAWSPGWTRQLKGPEDLGERLRIAGGIAVTSLNSRPAAEEAALRYDSVSLRIAEEKRDADQKAKVAKLRRRFVDGPVLVLPNAGGSFSNSGIAPIPGVGTVFPDVHVTAEWGVLEAAQVLRPDDRSNITVPAPASVQGSTLEGDGWTLRIAPGWVVRAGNRPGDFQLVRNVPKQ